jgi:hypothetical protein
MTAITVTAVRVKPLPGALIRDFVAGGTVNAGDLVYVDSNGKVQQSNGGAAGTANAVGIVVSCGTFGATAAASGETVSVAYFGPVTVGTSMTPGNRHYVSDTAGKLDTAAGTVTKVMGIALAADIFLITSEM